MKLGLLNKFLFNSLIFIFFPAVVVCSLRQEVPEQVKDLAGEYTGSWIMYGPNLEGKIVPKMKWTDTMTAADPQVKEGRAFVVTVDKMQFEGGIPAQEVRGIEGYYLKKDGSLGDYFFENFGQVYRMKNLGNGTWVYRMPAIPGRLAFLGFKNVISGRHVMVKEVTEENGTEVHRISRVTTVNWKDQEGRSQWKQYISLQGFHKRKR